MAEAITSVEICQGSHREWVQAGVLIPVVSAVVKKFLQAWVVGELGKEKDQ